MIILGGRVSSVDEVVCAFVGGELIEQDADTLAHGSNTSLGGFSQEVWLCCKLFLWCSIGENYSHS